MVVVDHETDTRLREVAREYVDNDLDVAGWVLYASKGLAKVLDEVRTIPCEGIRERASNRDYVRRGS